MEEETRQAVEALMLEKFQAEPFHNLRLLAGPERGACLPGGTCSEKSLSFLYSARRAGFDAHLHSAFIGEREIHRLVRVVICGRDFYADVGNGWPAIKLYPADENITYRIYGTQFRTEISDESVVVFHQRGDTEYRQISIPRLCRSEREILDDIEGRFDVDFDYPFSRKLRFALVVGNRFCFVRDERLEFFSEYGIDTMEYVSSKQLPVAARAHLSKLPEDLKPLFKVK